MQALIRASEPIACDRCGEQPKPVSSMLDPPTGRTFHLFKCQCGEKKLISLLGEVVASSTPAIDRGVRRPT
jgi:hypothetical protein